MVLIEISPTVDDLYGEEVMRDVFTDRVKEFTTAQLDHAFETARLLARQTRRMIAELEAESPDDGLNSVEVEFGVKFNGELQAYIAKANAEASMTIKLTWQIAKE